MVSDTDTDTETEKKCLIIFGGSGGIGSALAKRLKKDSPNIDIVITGRDRAQLERLGQELEIRTTILDV